MGEGFPDDRKIVRKQYYKLKGLTTGLEIGVTGAIEVLTGIPREATTQFARIPLGFPKGFYNAHVQLRVDAKEPLNQTLDKIIRAPYTIIVRALNLEKVLEIIKHTSNAARATGSYTRAIETAGRHMMD